MKCGRRVCFHGSFTEKKRAASKERRVKNAYILKRRVKGQGTRYIVATRRKR